MESSNNYKMPSNRDNHSIRNETRNKKYVERGDKLSDIKSVDSLSLKEAEIEKYSLLEVDLKSNHQGQSQRNSIGENKEYSLANSLGFVRSGGKNYNTSKNNYISA